MVQHQMAMGATQMSMKLTQMSMGNWEKMELQIWTYHSLMKVKMKMRQKLFMNPHISRTKVKVFLKMTSRSSKHTQWKLASIRSLVTVLAALRKPNLGQLGVIISLLCLTMS